MDFENEDPIQNEAEELAELLFGESYYALSAEVQKRIRARAIHSLCLEYDAQESIVAA